MSNNSIGQIGLDLVVNKNQFNSQMNGIQKLAKKTGKILAAAFATKKIIDFSKECLKLGSDLQEVQNVVDVTFPKMSMQVDNFGKNAAASFGLSETMAKKFTGTFGAMAKSFGFAEEQAYSMATELTGLAGDVASFYNITQDEAYTKLKSVFTGETESLKDLGVVMTQTALDSFAIAKGFNKTTASMSEAEKVALRYQFVQEKLSAAAGDFQRTSGGWANQVRILNLQFDSLKATIGQGLINAFTPVIKVVNALIGRLMTLANAFKSMTEAFFGKSSSDAAAQMSGVSDAAGEAASNTSSVGAAAQAAAKKMKSLFAFDELNVLSKNEDSTDSTGGMGSVGSVDFGGMVQAPNTDETANKYTELFGKIQKAAEPALTSLKRLWEEGLKPLSETIGSGAKWFLDNVLTPLGTWTISEVVPRFFDTLTETLSILDDILTEMEPAFTWFWDNVLQPISEWQGFIFLTTWDGINSALKKFSDWCKENPEVIKGIGAALAFLATVAQLLFNPIGSLVALGNFLCENWEAIKERISNALKILHVLWDFTWTSMKETISNIFTSMWNSIKLIINSILGGIEKMVNGVVNGINTMIRALNSLKFDIPDWVPLLGGKSFGLNITELQQISIPKLAQGGYVKANTPQLAMVGDNRHHGEVIAPEDKIYEISARAMADVMKGFMSELMSSIMAVRSGGSQNIIIKVSGEMAPFIRFLRMELMKQDSLSGVNFEVVYE